MHRLIQGHGEDKVVEYQGGSTGNSDEKMESVTLEYTYLLTTQLESQRHYFEEMMEDCRRENDEECQKLRMDLDLLRATSGQATESLDAEKSRLAQLTKEKETLEKKYQQVPSVAV